MKGAAAAWPDAVQAGGRLPPSAATGRAFNGETVHRTVS